MGHRAIASIVTVALLLAVACSDGDDERATVDVNSDDGEDGTSGGNEDEGAATAEGGPFVREVDMQVLAGTEGTAEIEITDVERTEDSTALYMTLTNLDGTVENLSAGSGDSQVPILVDPVSGRAFGPLVDGGQEFYGSHGDGENVPFLEGVHNELRFYYPALPADTETVSIHLYGMGVMTGIPVTSVDAHQPSPELGSDHEGGGAPPPGSTLTFPVREPDAEAQEITVEMFNYVEGPTGSTQRSGDAETIALQAEVLFDFDEATIRPDATEALSETAASIQANAAEGADTIEVVGHADGIGDPAYNQRLSEDRAQAVADELGPLLEGYSFDVSGRGSTEPVAQEGGPDDEAARARNRRVELRYAVQAGGSTSNESSESGVDVAERHVADPHAFRPSDGDSVANAESDGWRLDVFPLVRDGAYLVGLFELTNTGDAPAEPQLFASEDGLPSRYEGSSLGAFRLRESGSELTRYVALFEDPESDREYGNAADTIGTLEPGQSVRAAAWFPAPPVDDDEITLLAGSFGDVGSVPIE